MKRELIDALLRGDAALEKQILKGSLKALEARRVGAIANVDPDGADGGAVPDANAQGMHEIVKVGKVSLMRAKANLTELGVNISGIVK